MARLGIVAAVLVILVAAVYFGFRRAAENERAATRDVAGTASHPKHAPAGATASVGSAPAAGDADAVARPTIKRIDPQARARLGQQIEAARQRRGESIAAAPGTPGAPRELTKDYIRTQIRELIPLLTECYTTALEEDPKLAGKLVVSFTIGGEPELGGIVETSEIDPESTIAHPGMTECVRETMYAAELAPPADGGRVTVRYPFEFSN